MFNRFPKGGVVIPLIFPNVPQSSLGILRVPQLPLPWTPTPLRTLQKYLFPKNGGKRLWSASKRLVVYFFRRLELSDVDIRSWKLHCWIPMKRCFSQWKGQPIKWFLPAEMRRARKFLETLYYSFILWDRGARSIPSEIIWIYQKGQDMGVHNAFRRCEMHHSFWRGELCRPRFRKIPSHQLLCQTCPTKRNIHWFGNVCTGMKIYIYTIPGYGDPNAFPFWGFESWIIEKVQVLGV